MSETPAIPGADDFSVLGGWRYELRRAMRPPFEWLQVVGFNVALVLAGWFLLGPTSVTVSKFASLVFLPAVVASWAFGDVPATNLYGSEPERAIPAFSDPKRLRNFIMSRSLALWTLIAPGTALLSWLLSYQDDNVVGALVVAGLVLLLPFGFLGITAMAAPLLPYNPIPRKQRRALPHTWVRWSISVVIPYVLIGPATLLLLVPAALILEANGRTTAAWIGATAATVGVTVLVRKLAVDATIRMTMKRREALTDYLEHPERG